MIINSNRGLILDIILFYKPNLTKKLNVFVKNKEDSFRNKSVLYLLMV